MSDDSIVGVALIMAIMFLMMTGIVCASIYNMAIHKVGSAFCDKHKA